ncbi:unnamed protein product [Lupinus luteus]|uniref:Uncharacterized protein n=1 Tax=Lupinus luteus TaxID=3873 RepID=A0AAV1WVE6_LUPLU
MVQVNLTEVPVTLTENGVTEAHGAMAHDLTKNGVTEAHGAMAKEKECGEKNIFHFGCSYGRGFAPKRIVSKMAFALCTPPVR